MAKQTTKVSQATPADMKAAEEWAEVKGTKPYVFAAVSEAAGWAPGKKLTEREYDSAVDGWLKGAVGGR